MQLGNSLASKIYETFLNNVLSPIVPTDNALSHQHAEDVTPHKMVGTQNTNALQCMSEQIIFVNHVIPTPAAPQS